MEKEGCDRLLQKLTNLKDENDMQLLNIQRLCTDRSASISYLMKNKYSQIKHDYDPWHMSKSLKKKVMLAAKKKNCEVLGLWCRSITNHLWFCAESCDGDPDKLVEMFTSLLYHVTNKHSWDEIDSYKHFKQCLHDRINEERQWLHPNSEAFDELNKIMTDTRFLHDIRRLHAFVHTSSLEAYHSSMCKYVPKSVHFPNWAFTMRTYMAVMNHNFNCNRKLLAEYTSWRKATKQFVKRKYYAPADHEWRKVLLRECVRRKTSTSRTTVSKHHFPPIHQSLATT